MKSEHFYNFYIKFLASLLSFYNMQDPNEDTEWNDVLRAKGILPPKQKEVEISEDQIVNLVEQTVSKRTGENVVKNYEDMTLDELDEFEDEEDERVLLEYR